MPDLTAYLERIGHRGKLRADLGTLVELHRRHLLSIPYENLDVLLGRPVGLDVEPIYRKLVLDRRGGWCYEMNGLFAWALERVGFNITRLAAGVGRASRGDAATGNHLALCVHLDEPYLADVGFGDGLIEPVPIRPGPIDQRGFGFALEPLGDGWWRVHNHEWGAAPSFDFALAPGERSLFEKQCAHLQTSPESNFRQVAVVQRHVEEGLVVLRGRVLKRIRGDGVDEHVVADAGEYAAILRDVFELEPPDMDVLWSHVERAHETFLSRRASDTG
jgi:N-hydroxyarylamine O-acetyltransferase